MLMPSNATNSNQLVGRLGREAFSAFLEFLSASNFSGSLYLRGPDISHVVLVFDAGKILAARGQVMHRLFVGVAALAQALRWPVLELETKMGERPNLGEDSSLNMGVTEAMLESAQLIDKILDDQHLPAMTKLVPREQLSAYARLGLDEVNVYQRIKQLRRVQADVHVMDVRREMPGVEADVLLRRLVRRGLLILDLGRATDVPLQNSTSVQSVKQPEKQLGQFQSGVVGQRLDRLKD